MTLKDLLNHIIGNYEIHIWELGNGLVIDLLLHNSFRAGVYNYSFGSQTELTHEQQKDFRIDYIIHSEVDPQTLEISGDSNGVYIYLDLLDER